MTNLSFGTDLPNSGQSGVMTPIPLPLQVSGKEQGDSRPHLRASHPEVAAVNGGCRMGLIAA